MRMNLTYNHLRVRVHLKYTGHLILVAISKFGHDNNDELKKIGLTNKKNVLTNNKRENIGTTVGYLSQPWIVNSMHAYC